MDDLIIYSGFNHDYCSFCKVGRLFRDEDSGNLVCEDCGFILTVYVSHQPYDEKYYLNKNIVSKYTKISHFKKILEFFQGKEDIYISDCVLDKIKNEYKNFDFDINKVNTRLILKKAGLSRYYDNVNYINNLLGVKPININENHYYTLISQFQDIESLYNNNSISNLKSKFFHYYYILYKLCQINDFNEYLSEIPIIKTKKTIYEHELVFEQICQKLGWNFKRYFLILPINLTKLKEKLNSYI